MREAGCIPAQRASGERGGRKKKVRLKRIGIDGWEGEGGGGTIYFSVIVGFLPVTNIWGILIVHRYGNHIFNFKLGAGWLPSLLEVGGSLASLLRGWR